MYDDTSEVGVQYITYFVKTIQYFRRKQNDLRMISLKNYLFY